MLRVLRIQGAVAQGFENFRFFFTVKAIHKLRFASCLRTLPQKARKFAARAKEQDANARNFQSHQMSNLFVVEAFHVGEPEQLPFTGLELFQSPTHIGACLGIIFTGLRGGADSVRDLFAAPSIMKKIRGDPEEITAAFGRIHFRQLRGEETAIALLQQVIGDIATELPEMDAAESRSYLFRIRSEEHTS